jgi:hypothetical protein
MSDKDENDKYRDRIKKADDGRIRENAHINNTREEKGKKKSS